MNRGLSKNLQTSLSAGVAWRVALLCALICVLGVFSATRYGDDLIRKIVGDRETVEHARVLIEADLVVVLVIAMQAVGDDHARVPFAEHLHHRRRHPSPPHRRPALSDFRMGLSVHLLAALAASLH